VICFSEFVKHKCKYSSTVVLHTDETHTHTHTYTHTSVCCSVPASNFLEAVTILAKSSFISSSASTFCVLSCYLEWNLLPFSCNYIFVLFGRDIKGNVPDFTIKVIVEILFSIYIVPNLLYSILDRIVTAAVSYRPK
jgi:hypothetical protein